MSIEAMKQALEAFELVMETDGKDIEFWTVNGGSFEALECSNAMRRLRKAIGQAEKQEPVAIGEEWKPCVKLPIVVHVREQRKGEAHVSTREGITPVKEDDLIMRGVAGEEYPIGRELFNRTYTFDTAPVHASDMSEKRVQISDKNRHEWGSVTDDALIEEVRRRGFPIRDAQISLKIKDEYELCCQKYDTCTEPCTPRGRHLTKREWVGLTDEQIEAIHQSTWMQSTATLNDFARAIEAAHGIKEKNT
jgi:hypothetical protein